jgi:hypothetical protein
LWAGLLALFLYSPWLSVLSNQTQEVQKGFWVSPITPNDAERVLYSWSTGLEYPGEAETKFWFFFLGGMVIFVMAFGGRAGWFFFLQAAFPWILSLGFSVFSGRSIFLERCLGFAHFSLLGFWAVLFCRLPGFPLRFLLGGLLITTAILGLWGAEKDWPKEPPALAKAASFFKENYQPGELILAESPQALNRLRYYLNLIGVTSVNLRCPVYPFQSEGHIVHVASLDAEDILWSQQDIGLKKPGRVWVSCADEKHGFPFLGGWKEVWRTTFTGGGRTRWNLVLYEP